MELTALLWVVTLFYTLFIVFSSKSICAAGNDQDTNTQSFINQWSTPVENQPNDNLLLTFKGNQSSLVQHSCDKDTLLYAWGCVYLTNDGFATPLDPMYISPHLVQGNTGLPVLQSATFAGGNLILAVSGTVLYYDLRMKQAHQASGIAQDVFITHVASCQCCFQDTEWCQKQDSIVVAYNGLASSTDSVEYFLSFDAGRTFGRRRLQLDFDIKGGVCGATILGSLSSVAFLVVKDNSDSAQFVYDCYTNPTIVNIPKPISLPFNVTGNQTWFMQLENGLGSLVIWDSKNMYHSAVSGKAVLKVDIHSQEQSTFLHNGETVQQAVSNKNGDYVIRTTADNVYFGRDGIPPKAVKLPLKNPSPCLNHSCVVRFTTHNTIQVLYPTITEVDIPPANKLLLLSDIIHIQQHLTKVTPALQKCQHQGFDAKFHGQLFYMDIGQQLDLSAKVIPNAWEEKTYMVSLSNPGIISVNKSREVSGMLARGVTTSNIVAHISLVADTLPDGRKDEALGMSSLRLAVYDSSLMCHHKQQAVAYVVAGCPPNRSIRVRMRDEACDHMMNYEYTIDKDMYDPTFLLGSNGITATEDKKVLYDYSKLGCPIVVYYQDMLKPVIDLYEGEEFVEEVKEDYIVNEVNGMLTYGYAETASQAGCKSRPQSWLALLEAQNTPNPATAWTRQNYQSCLKEDGNGLTDPDQPYEVLSSRNNNKLAWSQYNSILVFNVSILNPGYSFCQLRCQFAVQVYGALPKSTLPPLRIMLYTCGGGLAALLAFYISHKLWPEDVEEEEGKDEAQEMQ